MDQEKRFILNLKMQKKLLSAIQRHKCNWNESSYKAIERANPFCDVWMDGLLVGLAGDGLISKHRDRINTHDNSYLLLSFFSFAARQMYQWVNASLESSWRIDEDFLEMAFIHLWHSVLNLKGKVRNWFNYLNLIIK